MRVSDDGVGMEREDAVLALARHATSKIRQADDLVGVATFGFRGEALAAICSVCAVEIETAAADGAGTIVRAAGGDVREIGECSRRRGTTVTVSRLFSNTPARLAFLAAPRSEWRATADALTTIALARRDVRLTRDARRPSGARPAAAPARCAAASPRSGAGRTPRRSSTSRMSAAPFTSRDSSSARATSGTATRRVFLTINGRVVRDHGIVRAAEAAYRSTLPAGVRPSLLLELTVPAELVDVNVHPTKAEVRFRDRWAVERAVEAAVRRALGTLGERPGPRVSRVDLRTAARRARRLTPASIPRCSDASTAR